MGPEFADFLTIPGYYTFSQHAIMVMRWYSSFKSRMEQMTDKLNEVMVANNFTDISQLYKAIAIR